MNTIWIVLPILTLLMFDLGLIACCPGNTLFPDDEHRAVDLCGGGEEKTG